MKLTDEQIRILSEAADILAAIEDKEVSGWYERPVMASDMTGWILKIIEAEGYQYEYPIGPEPEGVARMSARFDEIRHQMVLAVDGFLRFPANVKACNEMNPKTIGFGLPREN